MAPPGDSGGSGRGGGGGGGGGDHWGPGDEDAPPPQPGESPAGTARLGVQLTLGAIAALFFVFLVTLVVLRSTAPEWPPGGARMPAGLWASTALLVLSSGAMQLALRRTQAGEPLVPGEPAADLAARLAVAALLGSAFLGSQAWIWARLDHAGQAPSNDLYLALFYAATLMHALHVAGGVVLLFTMALRAWRGRSTTEGVGLAALYWHFMGVVWLFVFAIVWGPI